MTQVLRVNRFTGEFVFLDKDGRVIDTNDSAGLIDSDDADVLIERIRQGYQHITAGCYVIRLEGVGLYDTGYFEFTELITFDLDDDGYPAPTYTQLVSRESFEHPTADHSKILTSNAFIDYNNHFLAWMGNPLSSYPYVYDPTKAIRVCDIDDDVAILLEVGGRYIMRDKPDGFDLIPTRFYVE